MKQYKTFEVRDIQFVNQEKEGKKYLRGLIPFNSRSEDLGGFTEIISPTAFNKTLADGKNVWALLDHSREKVLGNTRSKTLALSTTAVGLEVEVEMPATSYASDAFELINRGITSSMSFGFYPVKHTDDPTARTRTLNEVKLEEVSFLISSDPAYPQTNAYTNMRSFVEEKKMDYEKLDEVFSKIKSNQIEENDKDILRGFVETLKPLYEKEIVVPPVITEDNTKADQDKAVMLLNLEIEQMLL